MKKKPESEFGERLRLAFDNAKNVEIARLLGVSEPAIKNYIDGRVPAADLLAKISELTNCSLHWLLTGEGEQFLTGEKQAVADDEEEFAAMFYNYRDLTEEDKEELRGLMAYVDHEITRRKKRRENNPHTADPARMEPTRPKRR